MPTERRVVAPIGAASKQHRGAAPDPADTRVRFDDGSVHAIPAGWALLPSGDAGLTRRVKAAGPSWTVQEKRGRKTFSRGVWAPAEQIARFRLAAAQQAAYVGDFEAAILAYLAFAPAHAALAQTMAERVAAHATPVGSGTVARTKRIPVEERAKAAVLAWMRHQTTDYDHRVISRQKGRRREVRRELSKASRRILARYRAGEEPPPDCPLLLALTRPQRSTAVPLGKVAKGRPAKAQPAKVGPATTQLTKGRAAKKPSIRPAAPAAVARSSRWGSIARRPIKSKADSGSRER